MVESENAIAPVEFENRPAMTAGVHFATFTIEKSGSSMYIGVVRDRPEDEISRRDRTEDAPDSPDMPHDWLIETHPDRGSGKLECRNVNDTPTGRASWPGMMKRGDVKTGDVVGLLLDIEQGTLAVYLNGERRGLMVQPGMTMACRHVGGYRDATVRKPVPSLGRSLRWSVELGYGSTVRVNGPLPPPSVAEAERAEDERRPAPFRRHWARLRS